MTDLMRASLTLVAIAVPELVLAQSTDSATIIANVTVVDVETGTLLPRQNVTITGTRIVSVSSEAAGHVPGARVVDGRGKFLIPGLWDMHVHTPAENETRDVYLPLEIANGVTGIRIMWGRPFNLRQRTDIAAGRQIGPRMVIGTPIIDGRMWQGTVSATSPVEARNVVDSLAKEGYDFIKVYQFLPREVYLAIADQAKRVRLTFTGHVPLALSAAEASNAGQRSFEHNIGIALSCARDEQNMRSALLASEAKLPPFSFDQHAALMTRAEIDAATSYDAAKCATLAATLRKNNTWVVPTLVLYRALGAQARPRLREDTAHRFMLPASRARYMNTPPVAEFDTIRPTVAKLATTMQRAGVGLMTGTDSGNPFVLPGFSVHEELALLVEAGLPPLEALRAATISPARFLNATASLGTIAAGKLADLVLLDANPLEDIRNTSKIRAVVANVRYFDRAALDSLLTRLAR